MTPWQRPRWRRTVQCQSGIIHCVCPKLEEIQNSITYNLADLSRNVRRKNVFGEQISHGQQISISSWCFWQSHQIHAKDLCISKKPPVSHLWLHFKWISKHYCKVPKIILFLSITGYFTVKSISCTHPFINVMYHSWSIVVQWSFVLCLPSPDEQSCHDTPEALFPCQTLNEVRVCCFLWQCKVNLHLYKCCRYRKLQTEWKEIKSLEILFSTCVLIVVKRFSYTFKLQGLVLY